MGEQHRLIQTKEAVVQTLAVEVKALKIGPKQVTQSVFRQLYRAELITTEGALAGTPWGLVNYFWNNCHGQTNAYGEPMGDIGAHLHVVWQQGTGLRRACVFATPPRGTYWETEERQDACRFQAVYSLLQGGWRGTITRERHGPTMRVHLRYGAQEWSVDFTEWAHYPDAALERALYRQPSTPPQADDVQALETHRQAVIAREGLLWHADPIANAQTCMRHVNALDGLIKTWRHAYQMRYEELAVLDQLFIAV